MEKGQVLRVISVLIIIAGIAVFILGIIKYHGETTKYQPLKEFKWDDAGQITTGDIDVETEGNTEVMEESLDVSNDDDIVIEDASDANIE